MKALYSFLGALVFATSLCCPALAAPIPAPLGTVVKAPAWVTGSEWFYSDGYALKVTSTSPEATVFDRIDATGQWYSRQGFLRKDSASGTTTRNTIYRTIPDNAGYSLSAGSPLTFQREYLSNGKLMVHASSWTVEGRETITVPAGTFDCWVIVWRTRSLKTDWTGFERWWYSPQVQQYVRLEYKYGPNAEGSRVLMRYHLGPDTQISPAIPQLKPQKKSEVFREGYSIAAADPPAKRMIDPSLRSLATSPGEGNATKRPQAIYREGSGSGSGMAGTWHAQVGSSKDADAMRRALNKLLSLNPQFASLPSGISGHEVSGRGKFYRAWMGKFEDSGQALTVCSRLEKIGRSCVTFRGATDEARES